MSRIVPDLSEDQLIQLRSGEEALVYKRCRDSFRCQLFVECVDQLHYLRWHWKTRPLPEKRVEAADRKSDADQVQPRANPS